MGNGTSNSGSQAGASAGIGSGAAALAQGSGQAIQGASHHGSQPPIDGTGKASGPITGMAAKAALIELLHESASALAEAADGFTSLITKREASGDEAKQLKDVVVRQRRLAAALEAEAARMAKRTIGSPRQTV